MKEMYIIKWTTRQGSQCTRITRSLCSVASNLVLRYQAKEEAVATDTEGTVIGRAWLDSPAWNWYVDQSYTLTDIPNPETNKQ